MKFIDEVKITIVSGHGGAGASTFRREKFVPRGGPSGGDGGKGGDVYFIASEGLNTLVHYRGQKIYKSEDGEHGMSQQCNGKNGEDLILKVPVGTLIRDAETNEIVADLTQEGQKVLLAKGGKGGMGNIHFKTSTNQAPTYSQSGLPGEEKELVLELKLMADIALVGLPNAGKSTLISSISAARPKVADYPFTTLEPNLGVVTLDKKSLVVADIPGLIEDASAGKGLGHKFLKHIERTRAIVHLIDCSMLLEPYEAMEHYITIRTELEKYSKDLSLKKELVCLTKIDAMTEEEITRFETELSNQIGKKTLAISSVSGRALDKLKYLLFKLIES